MLKGQPVVAVRVRAMMVRDANGQAANGSISGERLTDDAAATAVRLAAGVYVVLCGGGGAAGALPAGSSEAAASVVAGRWPGGEAAAAAVVISSPATAVYDRDAPTFFTFITRDTAAEITILRG